MCYWTVLNRESHFRWWATRTLYYTFWLCVLECACKSACVKVCVCGWVCKPTNVHEFVCLFVCVYVCVYSLFWHQVTTAILECLEWLFCLWWSSFWGSWPSIVLKDSRYVPLYHLCSKAVLIRRDLLSSNLVLIWILAHYMSSWIHHHTQGQQWEAAAVALLVTSYISVCGGLWI